LYFSAVLILFQASNPWSLGDRGWSFPFASSVCLLWYHLIFRGFCLFYNC